MKKRINISLDEDIAEKLRLLADDSKRNVSQWITDRVIEAEKVREKEGVSNETN